MSRHPTVSGLRRLTPTLARSASYLLIWAGLALLAAATVIRHYWGAVSVGQVRMNLISVQTDGGGGHVVWVAVIAIGVLPALITGALAAGLHLWRRRRPAWHMSRRARTAVRSASALAVATVVISGSATFASAVGLKQYVQAAKSTSDIEDYYADPDGAPSSEKRNLVVVYLESGEQTLADDQLFEKNAFVPLEDVTTREQGWGSVSDFQQYEGGGWTMAGIVATQCGIPLKGSGSGDGGNDIGGGMGEYLGGVTCLGDVLREEGYTNVFLGGANSSFAAKDVFLRTHGYTKDAGLQQWRAAGEPAENFRSDWGLSDERLMAHAKDEVDRLHSESERSNQPFHLSVLTLDTHEPVHVYDSCTVDTASAVTSVFECSMTQVAGFVEHMAAQGYLEDTSVVIMGDHLKHMSAGDAFHEQLGGHPDRTIFNRIWIPGDTAQNPVRAGADQLDMFPTLLEAAGIFPHDGRAGLGVSVRRHDLPVGAARTLEPDAYAELLGSLSAPFYARAWGQPEPTG